MWERIKSLLSERESAGSDGAPDEELQLAVAVLLVEAAHMDSEFHSDERSSIVDLLARRFELDAAAAEKLVDKAAATVADSAELYGFTRVVKDSFTHEDRVEMMEMLWEVAYADGELHDYEANLMRRVAGLIYVSDRESGEARKRALSRLGIDN
ncbi:TerB family tellurite resistance protein [Ferruginivarius sediminum]|uniref:TerB family tellurite resistance protein n=1 Tax=Ferruginivarius sediminum TaxID=2661937 RepID=A0A369TBT8_9PROT|nr:TerB family tellurite resistance protein [Ferruginivarius sediminum]RDD62312.1 TerB family tellurite resistance protein [Ferruginivarius sediminum]